MAEERKAQLGFSLIKITNGPLELKIWQHAMTDFKHFYKLCKSIM